MRAATILTGVLFFGFAIGCLAGTVPTSNGTLFFDDFSSGEISNKWDTGGVEIMYDPLLGNPTGSVRVSSIDKSNEVYGRPVMHESTTESEWVVEFDFRLDSGNDAGKYFLIYAGYAANTEAAVGGPVDVEIGIDASVDFQTPSQPWDFHVVEDGGVENSIDSNLEWDQWYHFTVHRVFATGVVDVYVDDNLIGSYSAYNSHLRIGDAQIGDPGNVQYGIANWDNFSIGSSFSVIPPPTLTDVTVSDTVNMTFDSTTGATYAVEFAESGTPTNWTPTGLVITGDGTTRFASDPAGAGTTRLYRLDVLGQ